MDSGEKMIVENFVQELLKAEEILNTEFSFDLAEPNYLVCLELIKNHPDLQKRFEESLIELFDSKGLSDEPVAYLMHKLRWSGVKAWVESELRALDNPIASGRSLEKVLDAYNDEWENKEFYSSI